MTPADMQRVVIEKVTPEIDNGRFPAKRIIGDEVVVEADIFADGHDVLSAVLLYKKDAKQRWTEVSMELLVNDRWRASFKVNELGSYRYTILAWVDPFLTWQQDLTKRITARQDISVELLIGRQIVEATARRAATRDAPTLQVWADKLSSRELTKAAKVKIALSKRLTKLMNNHAERQQATMYERELEIVVDRERARFGSWYELFPRSCSTEAGVHGTFGDCENRLQYIAEMGFDILYLPPIHPIGQTNRKGKNNSPKAKFNDPGTPWAIGAASGGHKNVHPQLGSLGDFKQLMTRAKEYGIEIALDIAFQCSPDHPYVKEHPEWFRRRPDGTIQYAENPPKKYQDIYPLEFDGAQGESLREELKSIVLFWVQQGVRIFRVDNPHTKPFDFWEWLIGEIKKDYPEVIFLSEAFTRPKIMYRLAKLGFSQSYTYFTWRNAKWELEQYFTELTRTEVRDFFRPNIWPNTPDILSDYLRDGGRPAFLTRLVLAATLGASYGIYGPAYELCENRRKDTSSEEYLNSEKYELKHWNLNSPDSIKDFTGRVNKIRHENPALHNNLSLRFHPVANEQLICYSKHTEDFNNVILVVVNLDYRYQQSGWVELALKEWGIEDNFSYQVHDLLNDKSYRWRGTRNYVELTPDICPAHIFRLEHDIAE